jgi:hypothetical protein
VADVKVKYVVQAEFDGKWSDVQAPYRLAFEDPEEALAARRHGFVDLVNAWSRWPLEYTRVVRRTITVEDEVYDDGP